MTHSQTYFLIPPLVALLPLTLASIHLRTYQALYLLCGAALIFMAISMSNGPSLVWILGALIAGEVVHFGLLAAVGPKISQANYSVLLSLVGLAPWWIGGGFLIFYPLLTVLLGMLYAHGKFLWAKNRAPVKVKSLKEAARKLPESDYSDFKARAKVIFAGPTMFALLLCSWMYLS